MMTPDEIRAGVQALEPWFHQIDLGHGILTKTESTGTEPPDHPHGTWQTIKHCLPDDLTGKSVLDVGCNAGFYAIEARRRNAARVLGIDAQRHHIRQARFAARALGVEIDYQRMSVYDLSAHRTGKFDITLALGLIYHCKHVLLALERLFQVTGEMMILESAVFPSRRLFESFDDSSGIGRRLHALAYVENDPASREAVYNWFIPTVDCLKAMLRDTGFANLEVISEANGRAVILCTRPRPDPDSLTMPQLLAAQITLREGPASCRPGDPVGFRIELKNIGQSIWLERSNAPSKGTVRLGVHLLDEWGQEIVHDCGGVPIEQSVMPGGEVVVDLTLRAPSKPGAYQLEFDMVSEHVTWFDDAGATTPLVHHIRVE